MRDPNKAVEIFAKAQSAATAGDFDHAIEMYIRGLRHDPGNMARHKQLLDVAQRHKVAGGEKAGMKDKPKSIGNDPVSKMLDAERLWAKDYTDAGLMHQFAKRAAEAHEAEPGLALNEVALWIASAALEWPGSQPKR